MGPDSACCMTSAECVQKSSRMQRSRREYTPRLWALKLENDCLKRMFLLTSSMASDRTLNRGTA